MKVAVVSLFPDMFSALTQYGVTGRAVNSGTVSIECWNPRDFTDDRHRTVDDRPYGGGPGMIMKPEPLLKAIRAARAHLVGQAEANAESDVESHAESSESDKSQQIAPRVIYLSPQGRPLTHQRVMELSTLSSLVLIAGRYEGIDERVCDLEVDEEISIGDYVLTGGELPAMVLLDSVIRQLPGVLGHPGSAEQDSFSDFGEGLLDCPHYTRPDRLEGLEVPSVLLSGDHAAIASWRERESLKRTMARRPDLISEMSQNADRADTKLRDSQLKD